MENIRVIDVEEYMDPLPNYVKQTEAMLEEMEAMVAYISKKIPALVFGFSVRLFCLDGRKPNRFTFSLVLSIRDGEQRLGDVASPTIRVAIVRCCAEWFGSAVSSEFQSCSRVLSSFGSVLLLCLGLPSCSAGLGLALRSLVSAGREELLLLLKVLTCYHARVTKHETLIYYIVIASGWKILRRRGQSCHCPDFNVVSFCHLQGVVHRDLKPKCHFFRRSTWKNHTSALNGNTKGKLSS
ncbi:hypothetical protein MRB53_018098 [Persea americana]|uniref:Uncharacterized protein n=1 Tax=Persea americana TaxID=3435 RepID=A0ACC2M728_PERAE|nr:hypothetical protein MRB53_018098 [Persea americana]